MTSLTNKTWVVLGINLDAGLDRFVHEYVEEKSSELSFQK